jgi:hypothetical protein
VRISKAIKMLFLLALVQVANASLATVHRGFGQKVNHNHRYCGVDSHMMRSQGYLSAVGIEEKYLSTEIDSSATIFRAYNLSVPIDHFQNESRYEPHSSDTFPLRYWFDASHYKEGGPVFLLESGETSGEGKSYIFQSALSLATNTFRSTALPTKGANRPTGTIDQWNCRGS